MSCLDRVCDVETLLHRMTLWYVLVGEGWVKSMIAAGATTLAPVLGRMVTGSPAPVGPSRPGTPAASKASTTSSETHHPFGVFRTFVPTLYRQDTTQYWCNAKHAHPWVY